MNDEEIISFLIAMVLCLSVTACGGSSGRADDTLAGKYIAITGTTMEMPHSGNDMSGFTLELKSGRKEIMEVNGESSEGKWINDDTTVIIDKTDTVGTIGKDTLVFGGILKELVGTSIDLKFAKEGTDAAKPENFLPEEERALLGDCRGGVSLHSNCFPILKLYLLTLADLPDIRASTLAFFVIEVSPELSLPVLSVLLRS